MANINVGRKSGLILRAGQMRRKTLWLGTAGSNITIATAGTAIIATSLSASGLGLVPFTVIRTRGMLNLRSDQEAASESQGVAYGHCKVSEQAVAIGVTAVPTPVTDSESDLWFVYQDIMNHLQVTPAGTGPSNQTFEFDSKAARKVEDGESLISVLETRAFSDGAGILVAFRQLIKLH